MTLSSAACIGVGNVGRSWAIVFAKAGLNVVLWDANPTACERALPMIRQGLHDLAEAAALDDAESAFARVSVASDMATAVAGADWIQESAAEQPAIKADLFRQLDVAAKAGATIASSTSAIPGSLFMTGLAGSHRCLVAHPVNPPHLIPLVELCGTAETAPETVAAARVFMEAVGQSPVHLKAEVEGFLLNRLQWALLGEAMHLVGEGYCSPEDIDRVLTDGLARRWAFIGPFAVAHLNATQGIEGYFDVLRDAISRVQNSLRTNYPPTEAVVDAAHAAMAKAVPVDAIADHQQWRDRALLQVDRFLADLKN